MGINSYYAREDALKAIAGFSKDREITGVYGNGQFSQRPNIIAYENDITEMTKKGIVSFHCSVERWTNPMLLRPGMNKDEFDRLRSGFDVLIDIDVPDIEYGKIAALIFARKIKSFGVEPGIKFTGGSGFHVIIPWESIPKEINGKPSRLMFPEIPQRVIKFLSDECSGELEDSLSRAGLLKEEGNPYSEITIDPMLSCSRHLFRMPYSAHEKSGLISLPLAISEILPFKKENALPDNAGELKPFISMSRADDLIIEAFDSVPGEKKKKASAIRFRETAAGKPVKKERFPPCMKKALEGMEDGKKRTLFAILLFLKKMNWKHDDIKDIIHEWNTKNRPPIPENYLISQTEYNKTKDILPPNCDKGGFYKDIGICCPDAVCRKIKNPANYPLRKEGGKKKRKKVSRDGRNNV